jgi:uncharacterized protein (TIGR03118 family)
MASHVTTRLAVLAGAAFTLAAGVASASPIAYVQTNLSSDIPGLAANTDPAMKNPWGMSYSPTSPFWVSDQVTGLATLYSAAGVKQALVVTIPGGGGPNGPTGQAFVGGMGFTMPGGSGTATFAFATLGGAIDAWNGGTNAVIVATTPGAVYTGLAVAGSQLYAADAAGNKIDVFDNNFSPVSTIIDPTIPAGFTPYNIQNVGGRLYVEYAKNGSPGGFISVFDAAGNLLQHANDPHIDEPWGITLAPAGFGDFGNDLLVGDLGDGLINAFDPATFAYLGTLSDGLGNPIANPGLWALGFRTGPTFDNDALFFTAGINGERDGLFGEITVAGATPTTVPEPATVSLLALGTAALARRRAGRTRRT